MLRFVVLTAVVASAAAAPYLPAQARAESTDSAWVASMIPLVRAMLMDDVIGIRADRSNRLSVRLGTALARERDVPGPEAEASGEGLPVCTGSREPRLAVERRGVIARVSLSRGESEERAVLSVAFECQLDGEPVAHGMTQQLVRGADGAWRKHGPAWVLVS
jgi:hypothetical protein